MSCIHDNCGSIGRKKKGVDFWNTFAYRRTNQPDQVADIENERMEISPVKISSVGAGDAIGFSEKTGNVKNFMVVSFEINSKIILTDLLQEISSFRTYVKPEYNDGIVKKISRLTGITDDMVVNAL